MVMMKWELNVEYAIRRYYMLALGILKAADKRISARIGRRYGAGGENQENFMQGKTTPLT